MDYHNKKQVILYIFIVGFLLFCIRAGLNSYYVIKVPHEDNWCKKWVEIPVGENKEEYRCVEFKNEIEKMKYYHNRTQQEHNENIYWGITIFGAIITILTFHYIPKWKNIKYKNKTEKNDKIEAIIIIIVATTGVAPLIYHYILPPPIEWFPDIFRRIHEQRVNEAMEIIKEMPKWLEKNSLDF